MYIIRYSNLASIELDSIFSYIANDNNFYAVEVIKSISNAINNFSIFPYMGESFGRFRKFVETKYKFIIIYEIDENKKIINIISIFKNQNNF